MWCAGGENKLFSSPKIRTRLFWDGLVFGACWAVRRVFSFSPPPMMLEWTLPGEWMLAGLGSDTTTPNQPQRPTPQNAGVWASLGGESKFVAAVGIDCSSLRDGELLEKSVNILSIFLPVTCFNLGGLFHLPSCDCWHIPTNFWELPPSQFLVQHTCLRVGICHELYQGCYELGQGCLKVCA